ncbi:AI-2E family transporter [Bernardetia sp. Wsw4-3y2]|uniref:AI-2E family transporter n=1 Tax=Bernardetia sp. Wsw4-3y2 TaxID=3127471 RepID=UPI0030D2E31F
MNNSLKLTISTNHFLKVLVVSIAVVAICYFASSVLLPLFLAIILAAVLDKPNEFFMQKWKFPKWLAITCSMILLITTGVAISAVVTNRVENISEDWEEIQKKSTQKIDKMESWSEQNLGFNPIKMASNSESFKDQLKGYGKKMAESLVTLLSQSFIILIYIVLLLMQKKMLQSFFYTLTPSTELSAMREIVKESGETVSNYLIGKGKIMTILFVMYYIGFLIGNVPYALFLALFAALFSIIPYVGNIIGGGSALVLASLYSGLTSGLIVLGVLVIAQILESYILTPWIVGDEIDLNPFATIFGVVVFSALWGVVGAVIALPVTGVLKVIFTHINGLEAYGFLLAKNKEEKIESY